MTKLTLREAAKFFDVSRPTLTKALNSGKLAGAKDEAGNWEIEGSEVARLYKRRPDGAVNPEHDEQGEQRKNDMLLAKINTMDAPDLTTANIADGDANTTVNKELQARLAAALEQVTAERAETAAKQERLAEVERRAEIAEARISDLEALAEERRQRIEDLRRILPPPPSDQPTARRRKFLGLL